MNELEFRDWGRKYLHTFNRVKIKGVLSFVLVSDTSYESGIASARCLMSSDGTNFKEDWIKIELLDLEAPSNSFVFDYKEFTYVFFRRPERQWRKGLCMDNSSIYCPYNGLLDILMEVSDKIRIDVNYTIWDEKLIYNLLFPKVETFNAALKKVQNQEVLSCSVSDKYFISSFFEKDVYILWRMSIPILYFNPVKKTYELIDKIYSQEALDFFSRHGEYYNGKA